MNLAEVLVCLENTDKREEFILRLKNAGENSTPCFQVQNAMVELKMNKAPRGIDEKTILQHTLKFTDTDECFQSFRLVCKSWKNAVETIKFNRVVPGKFFHDLNKIIKNRSPISPYFEKYLRCFKELHAPMNILISENGHHMISLILNNMKKLNYMCFYHFESLPEIFDPFILQMLENSHQTLQHVLISRFCIPYISFPKLKELEMTIGKDICVSEFKTYFPLVLINMERLQTVTLNLLEPGSSDVCEYIAKDYGKHCISACAWHPHHKILNILPVKIVTDVVHLEDNLQNCQYVLGLQYLHVSFDPPEDPMGHGWDKYREILDQCINLKEVEIDWKDELFDYYSLSQMSQVNQNIWQERFSYFEARGIRIVNEGEICGNESLQTKLTKDAGVTWKFEFL